MQEGYYNLLCGIVSYRHSTLCMCEEIEAAYRMVERVPVIVDCAKAKPSRAIEKVHGHNKNNHLTRTRRAIGSLPP